MFICCAEFIIQGALLIIFGIMVGYVVVRTFLGFGGLCVVDSFGMLAFRGLWVSDQCVDLVLLVLNM